MKKDKINMVINAREFGKQETERKEAKLLQAKIQALVVELLQVLDGQPLVHGLMALDTAKQIIQQEIETKSKK